MNARPDLAPNRQLLAQLFEERMNRSYAALSEGQRLERDTSLVKSYLVEAPVPEGDSDPERALAVVNNLLSDRFLSTPRNAVSVEMLPGDDRTLINMWVRIGNETFTSYVDIHNPRFWLFHSMGGSNPVDWFVRRLTTLSPRLDRAWIPIELLEVIAGMGSFRGLGLDFDHRPFLGAQPSGTASEDSDYPTAEEEDEAGPDDAAAPVEMLKMQLWGNKARDVLRLLRSSDAFPQQTTLAKVKVKYRLADDTRAYFSIDDVKFDGKVTARGTSFQSHLDLLRAIQSRYAALLRSIEGQRVEWSTSEPGALMKGAALILRFSNPIGDIDRFCETVFSGGEPFRLWGHPVVTGRSSRRIHGVDLHVGGRIQVEVSNDFLRVYLPERGCGNSVLRLYTNLQHSYDSTVSVSTSQGDDLIAL